MGCICLRVPENTLTPLETCGRFSGFAQAGFNILGCCTLPGRNLDLGARVTHVSVNSRTRDNVFVTSHITVIWAVCQDGDAFRDQHHPETRQRVSINESGKRLSLVPLVGEPEVHKPLIEMDIYDHGYSHRTDSSLSQPEMLYRAVYQTYNPEVQLVTHVEEYFRIALARHNFDELFNMGKTLTRDCVRVLNRAMNSTGYAISRVVVRSIQPDWNVRNAMNEIVATEKDKEAQIVRAEGLKQARIKGAEADSQVSRLHGEGIAMEREAVISGLKRSVAGFSDLPIGVEHVMNLLIMAQHTDMVKSLLQTSQDVQVLLPSSPVTASHIETSMNHTLQRASQEREEHNRIHTQTEPDDHQKTS